ncbi:MAG: DUF2853 family protein [Hyphomicrobiales bacterium]
MSDYLDDVRRFSPQAGEGEVKAITNYLGAGVLAQRDASLVSCTDPAELGRVRDNFAKKKLGLDDGDAVDGAIQKVCEQMKEDRNKSRVTFYYLLAEKTGTLGQLA